MCNVLLSYHTISHNHSLYKVTTMKIDRVLWRFNMTDISTFRLTGISGQNYVPEICLLNLTKELKDLRMGMATMGCPPKMSLTSASSCNARGGYTTMQVSCSVPVPDRRMPCDCVSHRAFRTARPSCLYLSAPCTSQSPQS